MKDLMKILIAYDGSECADAVLADLPRTGLPHHAEALVLTVTETWMPPPSALETYEGITHEQESLALARRARTALQLAFPEWKIEARTEFGSPASVLLAEADAWQPDLIVMGSHGRTALERFFFGSVSQKVLHEARCSVHVARIRTHARQPDEPAHIIIGVDGSPGAEAAIKAVAARHWPQGSEVRLVNGAPYTLPASSHQTMLTLEKWLADERARISDMMQHGEALLSTTGLYASSIVEDEEPKKLLCEEAERWQADVIFVGGRGMGRFERLLIGSVSAGVAARAECSVEVVRA